jgi:hypothetical protein
MFTNQKTKIARSPVQEFPASIPKGHQWRSWMRFSKVSLVVAAVGGMLLTGSSAFAGVVDGPTVSAEVGHALSMPLRTMTRMRTQPVGEAVNTPVGTTAGLNFEGQKASAGQLYSDAIGAAGATQYVQLVNVSYTIYDKTTGAVLAGPIAENALWSTFGGSCQTSTAGDGTVSYDQAAGRWILSHHAVPVGGPNLNCIAVSTTSDATGTYNLYGFALSNQFPDKPKIAIWPDAYYISQDLLDANKVFIRSQSCALDRTAMLAGNPNAQSICFQGSISLPTFLPATWEGQTPPPAGAAAYFFQLDQRPQTPNTLNWFLMHVDFVNPANSTFTAQTPITLPTYKDTCPNFKPCVTEPGTTNLLAGWGDRMMYRIIYRNFGDHESIVMTHSVQQGTGAAQYAGIRWYEFRTPLTPVLYQKGTYAPDANFRWVPSIAMDKKGDVLIGYNVSGPTVHPSLRYSGWKVGELKGKLETEASVMEGGGSELPTNKSWSSFSSMAVDPVDDCTFWFTGQYYATSQISKWNTRIASFKFSTCQ